MKLLLSIILLLCSVAAPAPAQTTQPATRPTDALFDISNFVGKPDLAARGWRGARLVTSPFTDASKTEPSEAAIRWHAREAMTARVPMVINVEQWPTDVRKHKLAVVKDSIRKLNQLVDWAHDEEPGLAVGHYSLMPAREWWVPVNYERRGNREDIQNYREWLGANTRLRTLGLARNVDFVCPSLALFYDDPEGNAIYIRSNLDEAAKFGKRIYPVLRFDYHDSTPRSGQLVSIEALHPLLEIARERSNGLMLWSGAFYSPVANKWTGTPWTDEIEARAQLLEGLK